MLVRRCQQQLHVYFRAYSQGSAKSRHAQWYSDMVPGMIPIALIGSTVYMALQLVRTNLSHEQYLEEARVKVKALEERFNELEMKADNHRQIPSNSSSKKWWIF